MLDVNAITAQNIKTLSAGELAVIATQMLARIGEQDKRIDRQAQAIKWRDAKIESIVFQLARLKARKFGAKSEAMNAEQRDIFKETLAADQASLEAQLAALQVATPDATRGVSASDERTAASPSAKHCLPTCRAWTSASSSKTLIARRVRRGLPLPSKRALLGVPRKSPAEAGVSFDRPKPVFSFRPCGGAQRPDPSGPDRRGPTSQARAPPPAAPAPAAGPDPRNRSRRPGRGDRQSRLRYRS